jgi:hypothetical protein
MIPIIISILNSGNHYGISERVNIAKGKYQIPTTWKDLGKNIKRRLWPIRKSK